MQYTNIQKDHGERYRASKIKETYNTVKETYNTLNSVRNTVYTEQNGHGEILYKVLLVSFTFETGLFYSKRDVQHSKQYTV